MRTEITPRCPGCSESVAVNRLYDTRLLGEDCAVVKCLKCGLVYKNRHPCLLELESFYEDDYVHFRSAPEAGLADINSAACKLKIIAKLLNVSADYSKISLLDIGCGAGQFVNIARSLGVMAEGIDPHLPAALQNKYLQRKASNQVAAESYDAVVLLNVAEHVVDPLPLFADAYRILRPHGVLMITCPYGNSLACKIYRDRWTHLATDEHLLFWVPGSLEFVLRRIGFSGATGKRISGSPFPYGLITGNTGISQQTANPQVSGVTSKINFIAGLQRKVWNLARWIQTHEYMANFIRYVVNITRLGDYLEFTIIKNG